MPTVFGASFKRIGAKAYYPTNANQAVGGGEMLNVKIPAHSHNKLFFPFNLKWVKLSIASWLPEALELFPAENGLKAQLNAHAPLC